MWTDIGWKVLALPSVFLCQIDRRLLQTRAFFIILSLFGEVWLSSFFNASTFYHQSDEICFGFHFVDYLAQRFQLRSRNLWNKRGRR